MGCLWLLISSMGLPPQHLWIGFGIYSSSLESGTDTRVSAAATVHACLPWAEICIDNLQWSCVLCFSSQQISKGRGFFLLMHTADSVFPPLTRILTAFPLCDIPLCGEREAEGAWLWVEEHALQTAYIKISAHNPVMPKAQLCPHIPPLLPHMRAGY